MALTKDIKNSVSYNGWNTFTYIIRCTEVSYDIATNKHRIKCDCIAKQSADSYQYDDWGTGVSAYVNGTQVVYSYKQRTLDGTSEHLYATGYIDVEGNNDGSCTISVTGKWWQDNPTYFVSGGVSVSGTMTLTTIPRATTITSITGKAVGSQSTLNVDVQLSTATHRLWFYTSNNSTWREITLSSDWKFTIPWSVASEVANSTSTTVYLVLRTYSGTTQIGSNQTASATYTITASSISSISGTAIGSQSTLAMSNEISGATYRLYYYTSYNSSWTDSGMSSKKFTIPWSVATQKASTTSFSVTLVLRTYYNNVAIGVDSYKTITYSVTVASIKSITNSNIGESSQIGVNNAVSGATYNLWYYTDKDSTWRGCGFSASAYTYALPLNEVASMIPTASNLKATIVLRTYYNGTAIGADSYYTYTAYLPSSYVPSISGINVSEANASVSAVTDLFINTLSRLLIEMSGVSASVGSSIASYKLEYDGQSYADASWTTPIVSVAGTRTIRATVVDKRGRSAAITKSVKIESYTAPRFTTNDIKRDSDNVETVHASSSGAISSIKNSNGNECNELRLHILYRKSSEADYPALSEDNCYLTTQNTSYSQNVDFTAIDQNSSYDFLFVLKDKFKHIEIPFRLGTAPTIMDLNQYGVGINKAWEKGALDVWGEVYINNMELQLGALGYIVAVTDSYVTIGNYSEWVTAGKPVNLLS